MSFTLPTFNLTCAIFTGPWPVGLHRLVSPCNLAMGRRVQASGTATDYFGYGPASPRLLLPALTDIRDVSQNIAQADYVEVPQSSGRWYIVNLVDDVAKGFDNEYRLAVLSKISQNLDATFAGLFWPIPMP